MYTRFLFSFALKKSVKGARKAEEKKKVSKKRKEEKRRKDNVRNHQRGKSFGKRKRRVEKKCHPLGRKAVPLAL